MADKIIDCSNGILVLSENAQASLKGLGKRLAEHRINFHDNDGKISTNQTWQDVAKALTSPAKLTGKELEKAMKQKAVDAIAPTGTNESIALSEQLRVKEITIQSAQPQTPRIYAPGNSEEKVR